MKTAKIISAGVATLAIVSSAALAQQALSGMITEVNRLNGTIAIKQTQNGTVGVNTGGAERFKVQGVSLDDFHAGDRVTYSASDTGGTRTITKLQRQ
jgi:Copper binding periplasmic protein CusF